MNPVILAAALAVALVPVGASAADAPAMPQPAPSGAALSLEHKTLIRCSAAFAIIAYEQGKGVQSALAFPNLRVRGKEYFVHAGAQLMDDLKLDELQVQGLYRQEVKRLQDESAQAGDPAAYVASLMQPCLVLLDTSGI